MANSEKFNTVTDLYNRLLPAINTKLNELKRMHLTNIRATDIWDFLVKYKWKDRNDLRMYEMVSDILNVDELELELYKKKKG